MRMISQSRLITHFTLIGHVDALFCTSSAVITYDTKIHERSAYLDGDVGGYYAASSFFFRHQQHLSALVILHQPPPYLPAQTAWPLSRRRWPTRALASQVVAAIQSNIAANRETLSSGSSLATPSYNRQTPSANLEGYCAANSRIAAGGLGRAVPSLVQRILSCADI
jgi:hypothetical protein